MVTARNPLLGAQREKAGSETAAKYAYQYHWALYRAIQEHSVKNEYAVFVELHEDVVICDSLDATKATFQFNQVKTNKPKFSRTALITLKKGKSVLGKLISSVEGKPFSNSVSELNLVTVSGFGLEMKDPDLKLSKITLSDIDDTELAALTLAIKTELSINSLPKHLQFIISDLPDKSFQNHVIGEISKLITSLYPGSYYHSVNIYRTLIDELNRKGEVTYDFNEWDGVLRNKALTSITVTKIINQFTNLKDEAKIEIEFAQIMQELKLNVMATRDLKKSFDRYRQSRIGNKSVEQLDTTKKIKSGITSQEIASGNDIKALLDLVVTDLEKKVKDRFTSNQELKAAIICEYIMEES